MRCPRDEGDVGRAVKNKSVRIEDEWRGCPILIKNDDQVWLPEGDEQAAEVVESDAVGDGLGELE